MTTWVSGGIGMSRSNLRLGASEGESDALFGKGSGSKAFFRSKAFLRSKRFLRCAGRLNEVRPIGLLRRPDQFAEQAVALEAADPDRQHLSDDVGRGEDVRRLQVRGAADDLAGIAGRAFEQHVDSGANRGPVEGRLLAVDQF